ncbi:MAG: hypothetical protein M0000_05345 [Actinomycetota bacterium]|nr:hypothetical protein [Actinomycetota bacterium]
MRVVRVEALGDELGVSLVLREHNRLPESVAPRNLYTAGHQVPQYLVHCVGVEEPLIDGFGLHAIGHVAVFVPLHRVPLVLFLFRKLVVPDPLALESERDRHRFRRDEEPVPHGLFE